MGMTLLVGVASWIIFAIFQAHGIYTGDSGDLVTAAFVGGVPHPPGYPLYTFLGLILSKLPFATPSWRVGLLSSVPHAVTVMLVYLSIASLTKKRMAALFGVLALVGNYLFFLYSVTPEVFALLDVFLVGISILVNRFRTSGNMRFAYSAAFLLGSSLAHHHMILFFVPAFALLLPKKIPWKALVAVPVGMLWYLYVPIAARSAAIINWDGATTLDRFIHLVSRADYGTFLSNVTIGQSLYERLLAIKAYGEFFVTDWTWIGVLLILIGAVTMVRRNGRVGWAWVTAYMLGGPLFFFYASFPIVNRFTLGTYERFLLPTYMLSAVAIGVGFARVVDAARAVSERITPSGRYALVALISSGMLFLYPALTGYVTLWRFTGFSHDRTAENLGRDILATAAPGSIILLSTDTPLFTTQYVRYSLNVRPDTMVLHASRMAVPDYQTLLGKRFPSLTIPHVSGAGYLSAFIKTNRTGTRRVYSNVVLPIGEGWYWVSRGLLYEAVPVDALPQIASVAAEADYLAPLLHDPRDGILSHYRHLMLSDVLGTYAAAHIAMAKTYMRAEAFDRAARDLEVAVALGSDSNAFDAYMLLATARMGLKECDAALAAVTEAGRVTIVPSAEQVRLTSVIYGSCLGNAGKAAEWMRRYDEMKRQTERPLETL